MRSAQASLEAITARLEQAAQTERYGGGRNSFFRDLVTSYEDGKAGTEALERLHTYVGQKAGEYTETDAQGGYLLDAQRLGVLERETVTPLMSVLPELRMAGTAEVEVARWVDPANAVAWVAELGAKPQVLNAVLSAVNARVHTLAGYSLASNQLLEDSNADAVIGEQLTVNVNDVIEAALLNGSGTNQPLGITQTTGVNSRLYDDASPTVVKLLAVITQAIVDVVVNHKRMPTHIVMRPQTWYRIVADPTVAHLFTLVPPTLLGLPVILSTNITGTYQAGVNGAATGGNQARVIVMDARAQLFLNRSDMAIDLSDEANIGAGGTPPNVFLTNQTVIRGERRVGALFSRRPASISIVHGTGLVNTLA
ncbi:MAG TPA: phage major capsid protein [Propionibacteriaceae bacterium]|nr:phage major capsid protein [Propionibacteriaceae bacterium]